VSGHVIDASPGFAWGDFGIGAAAVAVMSLLVGLGVLAARQNRGKKAGSIAAA
jgi:hypothetical protein